MTSSGAAASAPVMLFDGVCNVCNWGVQFVLKHERAPDMQFASLQSSLGRELVAKHGLSGDINTVVVIEPRGDDVKVHVRSSAVIAAMKGMRGAWPALAWLSWIVPWPIRDVFYVLFARNRYRIFGKRDACMVPTPELRARFLA